MADIETIGGGAGGGGLMAIFVGIVKYFTVDKKQDEAIKELQSEKLSTGIFEEYRIAQTTEHAEFGRKIDKLFDKIEDVHRDMPKRRGD